MHRSLVALTALALARSCLSADLSDNGAPSVVNVVQRTVAECASAGDLFRCLQIRALRAAGRVRRRKDALQLIEGVDVVRVANASRAARTLPDADLEQLDSGRLSELLMDAAYDFLDTHAVTINLRRMVEEGRAGGGGGFGGGKKRNRYAGPFLAALAIKGVVMTMAYKGIAVMAGSALIIGKIALVLAAILGLKKLVSSDKEKTTVEIVKHPSYSSSHSHSSTYEEADGHYRRSMPSEEDIMLLDNITRQSYAF